MKRIFYPVYGGEHDNETDFGKDCGEQRANARRQFEGRRAAVKGAGHRQGMRVLGILAGLVAVMGLIAYGQEQARQEATRQEQTRQKAAQQEQARKKAAQKQQAQQELQEAIATVLNGQGVPQAAEYDKSRPGPPRLVLVTRSGKYHKWTSSLPADWIAKTVSEMALIVVVENKEIALSWQSYNIGPSITRYRHDLWIVVRAAQTGVLLDNFSMKGEEPEDLPDTAPINQTRIDGRKVNSADFAEVLSGHLELLGQNSGEPTGRRETNPIGMTFLELGPGSFAMGSTSGESDEDERPVHRVAISRAFYLQTTEVTQGQWRAILGNNPSQYKKGDDFPVETVSWADVQEFLKRLNQLDPGKNYRLPTEAEWEYACRAGTTGERYGELDAIAWYSHNSGSDNQPVGRKQPNAWGLYDMLGNVWEWCADWYDKDYYARSPSTDPRGPESGKCRVLRGGSRSLNNRVRSADRYGLAGSGFEFGFRCARD